MNATAKVVPTDDEWEDRSVGAQEEHVGEAPDITAAVDAALELYPISIRLQKSLVESLKALASLNGLGYQPLIRQILTRWVDSELKQMVIQRASEIATRSQIAAKVPKTNARTPQEPRHKKAA